MTTPIKSDVAVDGQVSALSAVVTAPLSVVGITATGAPAGAVSGANNGTDAVAMVNLTGAAGGDTSSTTNAKHGGAGGEIDLTGGVGGAATGAAGTVIGGTGGAVNQFGGAGGTSASTSGTGGQGGSARYHGGTGGAETSASGSTAGGAGGLAYVQGGDGGTVASSAGVRGTGGNAIIVGGNAATGTGTGGAAGNVLLAHDSVNAIGAVAVCKPEPAAGIALDVLGRVAASAGFNGILQTDLPYVPACMIAHDATQLVPTTGLYFNFSVSGASAVWDRWLTAGNSAMSSNPSSIGRITVPVAGVYLVFWRFQWDNVSGPLFERVVPSVNHSTTQGEDRRTPGYFSTGAASTVMNLAANDYLELYADTDHVGGTIMEGRTAASGASLYFGAVWMGK